MWLFTEHEIIAATGGIRIGAVTPGNDDMLVVDSVSTDTRTIEPGALFVALTGERFDGHAFCQTAFEKDASILLVSDEHTLPEGAAGILVPDTLLALQVLACAYRRKLGCKVIAVTGSVGKTSTREMLYAALSHSLKTHATKHNLNNEIGLPLTILSAPIDTELLIVEMGMRLRGEIHTLTHIAEPDIAVITNVGVSHIERLGSQEEILLAKMEICDGLSGGKILLINGDDTLLADYVQKEENKKWNQLGMTSLDMSSENLLFADQTAAAHSLHTYENGTGFLCSFRTSADDAFSDIGEFVLPCVGVHHVKNALFSIACAQNLGIPMENVKKGLMLYKPAGSRGRMVRTAHYLIYDDAYNASPESMAAAFESVRLLGKDRRKIAAVGGILELGSYSSEQHYKVGQAAANSEMDLLFVCGDNREDVKAGALSVRPDLPVYLFAQRDELTQNLLTALQKGDIILIKASHAFEMQNVTQAIIEFDHSFSSASEESELV